jgi:hypothetical protein
MPVKRPFLQKQQWMEIVVWPYLHEDPYGDHPLSLRFTSMTPDSFHTLFRRPFRNLHHDDLITDFWSGEILSIVAPRSSTVILSSLIINAGS